MLEWLLFPVLPVFRGVKGSEVMIWTDGPDLKTSASQGATDGENADNILSWK